ncbi:MAG: S24 family peptidase, partial [Bacteroidales bacterium]|nr:S24 family peptidase [Bacteroidales bacterium]
GFGQSFVSQIEHSDRPMPEAVRDKLLSLDGVDKSALLRKREPEESGKERALLTGSHMVPVLPIVAHGGKLTDFIASVQEGDCEWAISPIPGADMIIPITGDSMAPEYNSGDRVVVKRVNEKAFLEWGHVYVLSTVNGVVIKQLRPGRDESCVECWSLNKDERYAPFTINLSDVLGVYKVLLNMSFK